MLDLVFYSDSTLKAQPYTTPEVIAANTGIKRRSVIDLIARNKEELEKSITWTSSKRPYYLHSWIIRHK